MGSAMSWGPYVRAEGMPQTQGQREPGTCDFQERLRIHPEAGRESAGGWTGKLL